MWLVEKIGPENYLFSILIPPVSKSCGIGIYIGFVPLVDGKLNARKLFNKTYKEWYLEFCEKVGKPFGMKPYPKEKTDMAKKIWFNTPFYPEEDEHDGKTEAGNIAEAGTAGTGEQHFS